MGKKRDEDLGLVGAFAGDHAADGLEDNFEVQPEVVVEDVPGVQIHPLLICVRVVALAHLPDAGDAGFHGTIYTAAFAVIVV